MLMVQAPDRHLVRSAVLSILPPLLLAVLLAWWGTRALGLGNWYVVKALVVLAAGATLVLRGLPDHHPFRSLGAANRVTVARGVLVALLAALAGERDSSLLAGIALAIGTIAAALDGLDGWLARKSNMVSRFGARFDMETDALLILVLAVLTWQFDKAGAWVLFIGLLRYAFVVAGRMVEWLRAPLFPSLRRKAIAVVQMVALLFALAPFVPRAVSAPIAAAALATLVFSFLVDVAWLRRQATRVGASEAA